MSRPPLPEKEADPGPGGRSNRGWRRWRSALTLADQRRLYLLASGLIVGESLFLVMTAGVIVSTNNEAPFAMLPEGSTWPAMLSGIAVFAVLTLALYSWVRGRSAKV